MKLGSGPINLNTSVFLIWFVMRRSCAGIVVLFQADATIVTGQIREIGDAIFTSSLRPKGATSQRLEPLEKRTTLIVTSQDSDIS
ncbi:hypothetical protein ASD8599_02928 [Ascidiaceihabitans donghaensis]|uniref:Uncharacterized protein n=1 Tax=Ascidiaceihabitans donghaensis TaxID=1510460 RepID=A0A2R8BGH1_9RHOB|nr:hypothetical protein ASD8599_02928 [Ascidiaceihabitans donghaensis]